MKTKLIKTFLLGFVTLSMMIGCDINENANPSSSNNANPSQSSADTSSENSSSDNSSSADSSNIDASSSNNSSSSSSSAASSSSSSSSASSSASSSSSSASSSAQSSSSASSSSSGSSSQAPNNKAFPVALIVSYFESEGEAGVEVPALVAPDNAADGFTVRDGMLGGVMVEVSCTRDDMLTYFQEFFDCGWFVTSQIGNDDEWKMNYLGFTTAYVDFWFNRYSISFDFFIGDIPEEDPSLDPDMGPLSTSYPFPSDNVVSVVYEPNGITVQMPTYSSPTTAFSMSGYNQGVTLTVYAQNLPNDEKTALINAFKAVGWALKDGSDSVYKYADTRAIFTVIQVGRMFQLKFEIEAE